MKNRKRTVLKKRAKKLHSGTKPSVKMPAGRSLHKSDPKGWLRIESDLLGLSEEIEMVDEETEGVKEC